MPSTKTKPSNSPAANSPNSPPAQHPNRVTRARIRPGHAHCRSLGVPGISPRQQNDARASRAPFRAAAFLAPGSAGPAVCPPPCAVARWVPGFGPSCLWVSDDLERTTGLEPSTLTLGNAEFCWSPLLGDEAARWRTQGRRPGRAPLPREGGPVAPHRRRAHDTHTGCHSARRPVCSEPQGMPLPSPPPLSQLAVLDDWRSSGSRGWALPPVPWSS